ncbi:MAG TPA: DUF2254 family protein [Acidimicrobiia bacterium]|nr:DUF2254 family protein [Acidimicrobiia bacterium]
MTVAAAITLSPTPALQGREAIRGAGERSERASAPTIPRRGEAKNGVEGPGLVELVVSVGDAMASGDVVARVRRATRQAPNVLLRRALVITVERTIEQDPKYAIRLLVDIAIRALSPAVNDPTTAVLAIDHIEDMLHRIAGRKLEQGHVREDGRLQLVFPTPSWEDLVALATDEIRIYGARSVQVMRRLLAMLAVLLGEVPELRRGPLVDRQARVRRAIDRNFEDPDDRAEASQADTQGLGLSRG